MQVIIEGVSYKPVDSQCDDSDLDYAEKHFELPIDNTMRLLRVTGDPSNTRTTVRGFYDVVFQKWYFARGDGVVEVKNVYWWAYLIGENY